jgi:hypothetical protein
VLAQLAALVERERHLHLYVALLLHQGGLEEPVIPLDQVVAAGVVLFMVLAAQVEVAPIP